MNRAQKEEMLKKAKYAVGDDVELIRGKHRGSVARITHIDAYNSWEWNGQSYGPRDYLGYTCVIGKEEKRYRAGSLRLFAEVTEQELDDAAAALMRTYEELVG